MQPFLAWAESLVTQGSWFNTPLSSGAVGTPRGARLSPPPLPPEPSDPEQRAFYHNVLEPMVLAINAFNARASAQEVAEDAFAQMWFQQQSSNAP